MGQNEGGEFAAQLTETGPPPLCHRLLLLLVLRRAVGVDVGRPVGMRGSGIHKHTIQLHIHIQAWPHYHRDTVCAHAHFMHNAANTYSVIYIVLRYTERSLQYNNTFPAIH